MANGKREFEIKINGISQSIDDVTKLGEALKQLEDVEKSVSITTQNNTTTNRDQADAQNNLIDAINATTDALNDLSSAQQAATAALQQQTQAVNTQANAGNSAVNSIQNMKAELEALTQEWSSVDVGSDRFEELALKIEIIKQRLQEVEGANVGLINLGSTIDSINTFGKGLVDTINLSNGVLNLFGIESDTASKAVENITKAMELLSTVQAINNGLTQTSIGLKLKDLLAEKSRAIQARLSTVATNASSASLKLFSKALIATGVGAFVFLLGTLIAHFDDIKASVLEVFPELEGMGELFNQVKAIAAGLGQALVNYLLAPIKTIAAVARKIMDGDFFGAIDAGVNGMLEGLNVIGNIKDGYEKQLEKSEKDKQKEKAKNRAKELEDQIKDNEAKYGSDWKYTEKAQKAYNDLYEEKKILYQDDAEALKELEREHNTYLRTVKEHTDALAKRHEEEEKRKDEARQKELEKEKEAQQKAAEAHKQALETYKNRLKSFQNETYKMELANEQKKIDIAKKSFDKLTANSIEELKEHKTKIEQIYNQQLALKQKLVNDEIEALEETYKELISAARAAGQSIVNLEEEKQSRIREITEAAKFEEDSINEDKQKKLDNYNKLFTKQEAEKAKKIVASQKETSDQVVKEVDEQYKAIQKLQEEAEQRTGLDLIDVKATKANYEIIKKDLKDYIQKTEEAKDKLKKIHEENLSKLNEYTPEYQKEIEDQYNASVTDLDDKIAKANDAIKTNKTAEADLVKKYWTDTTQKVLKNVGDILKASKELFSAVKSIYQSEVDEMKEEYDKLNERYDEVTKKREESASRIKDFEQQIQDAQGGTALALREQLAREMQAKAELDQEEKRLAKEKEKREADIAKKEKQMKRIDMMSNIAVATGNVAESITKMMTAGPFVGQVLAAMAAAAGAIQIGVMTKQLAKLEKGGLLSGPSHTQGGMRIQGSNIEVEGGEYVINKRSTARNQQLIEYINSSNGTVTARDIANLQGIPIGNRSVSMPSVQMKNTYTTEDKILEAIEGINFRPVVSVKDINDVQSNIVNITDIAGIE